MSTFKPLHTFTVNNVTYHLCRSEHAATKLGLFRGLHDPFGTEYTERVATVDYAHVLLAMTRPPELKGFPGVTDWSEKWRQISTETSGIRHVLLTPHAAVEVGPAVKTLRLDPAINTCLETTLPRWSEVGTFGSSAWILDVIRMILEAP